VIAQLEVSTITVVSNWLSANELLASLIILPIVSALVGGFAAWISAKRAIASERANRSHRSAIEIGSYRQAWIDALRDDLSEFTGLTAVAYVNDVPPEKVERVSILRMRIQFRMNREDPDYEVLIKSLDASLEALFLKKPFIENGIAPIGPIAQRILKWEWERLKVDLREADQ